MSAPFRLLHLALSPLVALIEGITNALLRWTGGKIYRGQTFRNRNELRLLMEDTSQSLTSEERGMINRVFEMQNISVRQLAIPFARLTILNPGDTLGEAFIHFRNVPQNVLPVWTRDQAPRKILGFLELKRVLFMPDPPLADPVEKHVSRPMYLDEDLRVHEALRRMQRNAQRIAVVLARDGREIGLVTLEEITKVIFGEVKL
jgi:CBS domain containing-hemolysin-like protein